MRGSVAVRGDDVHVDVEQRIDHLDVDEPRLFFELTQRRRAAVRVIGLDVTARLEPQAQLTVTDQQEPLALGIERERARREVPRLEPVTLERPLSTLLEQLEERATLRLGAFVGPTSSAQLLRQIGHEPRALLHRASVPDARRASNRGRRVDSTPGTSHLPAVHPVLRALGYEGFFEEQMTRLEEGLVPARVVGQHRREWDVSGPDVQCRAVLAGKRWAGDDVAAEDAQPTIGDWVALRRDATSTVPVIEHVLTRRTELARAAVGKRGARQIVVANVDWVIVVAAFSRSDASDAAAQRSLNPRRIERYLTAIEKGGAQPLVLVNKADLRDDVASEIAELSARLAGVAILPVSCKQEGGLDALRARLGPGKTAGFVGLSGVGKSTIVNQLVGGESQRTAEERASDTRGRHTTTHRELFVTDAGWLLIDTPGMREFALGDAEDADLEAFSDIAAWALDCRFRDCRHREEPGCAVQAAVRDGRLAADRFDSYRVLSDELEAGAVKNRGGAAPPMKRRTKNTAFSPRKPRGR